MPLAEPLFPSIHREEITAPTFANEAVDDDAIGAAGNAFLCG